MQGDTSLIIDATRKASRFLQRDFFELENLQSVDKGKRSFCQKSCIRTLQVLQDSLSKYYKTIIFDNKEAETSNFTGKAALIEILDGLGNLERSLPFFAIMVTIISKKNDEIITEKSIMNFPALGEIYYTEKGKGAWMERHSSNFAGASRVRVSGCSDVANALVVGGNSQMTLVSKISSNIRLFESYSYALSLFICGKIDVLLSQTRAISVKGVELFIKEAGGACYIEDNLLVASNFKLHEKIKSFI